MALGGARRSVSIPSRRVRLAAHDRRLCLPITRNGQLCGTPKPPNVAMVEPSEPRERDHISAARRLQVAHGRRVLVEPKMGPVLIEVRDV